MKPCLLDTNILFYLFRAHPTVQKRVRRQRNRYGHVHLSAVTYYEVYHGWSYLALSPHSSERRQARNKLFDFETFVKRNSLLNLTFDAVQYAGEIKARRRRAGLPADDDLDYLIAGTALANGLVLVTHNVKDFTGIDGLETENWLAE